MSKVEIEHVAWTEKVEANLHGALDTFEMADVANQVRTGRSECWKINDGYVVTRVEVRDTGDMLIIIAAQSEGLTALAPLLPEICEKNNIVIVKFHSKKKGMTRLAKQIDFEVDETVFKWEP